MLSNTEVRRKNIVRWICTSCPQIFTVYGDLPRRPFCPKCGQLFHCHRYTPDEPKLKWKNSKGWTVGEGRLPAKKNWTDEETERLLQLRREGATVKAIAATMGLSYNAVKSRLCNIKRRPKQK